LSRPRGSNRAGSGAGPGSHGGRGGSAAGELLFAAAHEFDDPLGADEAVLGDVAEDFEVALSDLEFSGAIGIALEARKPRLRFVSHVEIVSRMKPPQVVERLLDSRCHRHFSTIR
jgi:hypothetical protein